MWVVRTLDILTSERPRQLFIMFSMPGFEAEETNTFCNTDVNSLQKLVLVYLLVYKRDKIIYYFVFSIFQVEMEQLGRILTFTFSCSVSFILCCLHCSIQL